MSDLPTTGSEPEESSAPRTTQPTVLWVAPNLNDYKARFLDVLSSDDGPQLTVLAGGPDSKVGHRYGVGENRFERIDVAASKSSFAFSPRVFLTLYRLFRSRKFGIVVMPIEKKHLPVVFFLLVLRKLYDFHLISYNHPCLRNKSGQITPFNLRLTRRLFRLYDHVIFYTEQAREWAISRKLIAVDKSSFANNTLDTDSIWRINQFRINGKRPLRLLFIGRLVSAKRLDLLIEYYDKLLEEVPELHLEIVGDGPDSGTIVSALALRPQITWHGALTDEMEIAKLMNRSHAVFVPGHSGLSIVHAFCYGKPYITLTGPDSSHPPEIDYLRNDQNGLRLDSKLEGNVSRIVQLLTDSERYVAMCRSAWETGLGLSVQSWKEQIQNSLHCLMSGKAQHRHILEASHADRLGKHV